MSLGENTVLFAMMPLIGSAAVLFGKGVTVLMPGKIVITLVVASGCIATLSSVHSADSGTNFLGHLAVCCDAGLGLIWEVMGFWSRVETKLNKKTGNCHKFTRSIIIWRDAALFVGNVDDRFRGTSGFAAGTVLDRSCFY